MSRKCSRANSVIGREDHRGAVIVDRLTRGKERRIERDGIEMGTQTWGHLRVDASSVSLVCAPGDRVEGGIDPVEMRTGAFKRHDRVIECPLVAVADYGGNLRGGGPSPARNRADTLSWIRLKSMVLREVCLSGRTVRSSGKGQGLVVAAATRGSSIVAPAASIVPGPAGSKRMVIENLLVRRPAKELGKARRLAGHLGKSARITAKRKCRCRFVARPRGPACFRIG